jgi:hypothetical protein
MLAFSATVPWLLKAVAFFFLDTLSCDGRVVTILSDTFFVSRGSVYSKIPVQNDA